MTMKISPSGDLQRYVAHGRPSGSLRAAPPRWAAGSAPMKLSAVRPNSFHTPRQASFTFPMSAIVLFSFRSIGKRLAAGRNRAGAAMNRDQLGAYLAQPSIASLFLGDPGVGHFVQGLVLEIDPDRRARSDRRPRSCSSW